MSETVWKWRPFNDWQIEEYESWFMDLAEQGLHFQKARFHFACFEKGESKKMNYRIELTKNKKISQKQIDFYEAYGWSYVTSFQFFHVFSSPVGQPVEEIHTDLVEQSHTLEHLMNYLKVNMFAIAVTISFLLLILLVQFLFDKTPILTLVEGMLFTQFTTILILSLLTVQFIQAMFAIQRLRQQLLFGQPMNHRVSWKKAARMHWVFMLLILTIGVSGVVIPIVQLFKGETVTLPIDEVDLPFVRLAELEQHPDRIREEDWHDGVDRLNQYSTQWSILAPVQYKMVESNRVPSENWKDGSGVYSPSIHVEMYELRLSILANRFMDDLVKRYEYKEVPVIEMPHKSFNRLVIVGEEDAKSMYAVKDNWVLYVRYYGYVEVERLIEKVAQRMD